MKDVLCLLRKKYALIFKCKNVWHLRLSKVWRCLWWWCRFRHRVGLYVSTLILNMEAVCSSETILSTSIHVISITKWKELQYVSVRQKRIKLFRNMLQFSYSYWFIMVKIFIKYPTLLLKCSVFCIKQKSLIVINWFFEKFCELFSYTKLSSSSGFPLPGVVL